ncbi:hypothetical protein [Glycomyces tenuis]|uniref:hypothetical protein n=1 Tax=Glycomyces tenuis TaxID=58116 RepID=UPI0004162FD0|nr:hypothetical protein [Glycomyces tenuis]
MHALVQALADVCAEAEGEPRRPVPRLASDLHLPEQLQVVGLDLLDVAERLTAEQREAADAAIARARERLF